MWEGYPKYCSKRDELRNLGVWRIQWRIRRDLDSLWGRL